MSKPRTITTKNKKKTKNIQHQNNKKQKKMQQYKLDEIEKN